jgi:hypothetical protein
MVVSERQILSRELFLSVMTGGGVTLMRRSLKRVRTLREHFKLLCFLIPLGCTPRVVYS